jgi:hypothetical protein
MDDNTVIMASGAEGAPAVVDGATPHVMNKRSEGGCVVFGNLLLGPAPPMYRPFMVLDEEERIKALKKKGPAPPPEPKKTKEGTMCM